MAPVGCWAGPDAWYCPANKVFKRGVPDPGPWGPAAHRTILLCSCRGMGQGVVGAAGGGGAHVLNAGAASIAGHSSEFCSLSLNEKQEKEAPPEPTHNTFATFGRFWALEESASNSELESGMSQG